MFSNIFKLKIYYFFAFLLYYPSKIDFKNLSPSIKTSDYFLGRFYCYILQILAAPTVTL
jgi:hypothetical protein